MRFKIEIWDLRKADRGKAQIVEELCTVESLTGIVNALLDRGIEKRIERDGIIRMATCFLNGEPYQSKCKDDTRFDYIIQKIE